MHHLSASPSLSVANIPNIYYLECFCVLNIPKPLIFPHHKAQKKRLLSRSNPSLSPSIHRLVGKPSCTPQKPLCLSNVKQMQSDVNFPLVLCKPTSQIIQPKFNQCKRFVLHPHFSFIYLTISILGSSIIFGLSLKYTLRFVPSNR